MSEQQEIPSTKQEYTCGHCGKQFVDYRLFDRKYCSRECGYLGQRRERRACGVCGTPVRLPSHRYCSRDCSSEASRADQAA